MAHCRKIKRFNWTSKWVGSVHGIHLTNYVRLQLLCTLFAGVGLLLGRRMASGDSRRDGDLAVAIFLGYAIGQWMPKFF
jgi:hypothetical protein